MRVTIKHEGTEISIEGNREDMEPFGDLMEDIPGTPIQTTDPFVEFILDIVKPLTDHIRGTI